MAKILFAPLGIVGGLMAGFAGKKLFDFVWARVDEEEPPEPEHRDASMAKLAAALALEGAIFRAVRGVAEHASRRSFERYTGTWPGEKHPETT
jgi:hypothetical protein